MYRFLLTPRWILSHLFVLACVIGFVSAGFWQLRRLDERKASNAEISAAEAQPSTTLDALLPGGAASTAEEVAGVQYRAVTITGTYRTQDQVLIRNRTFGGSPGYWVITPLQLPDGSAVAVNRGWVPYATSPDGPWDAFAPPTGPVTVTGMVREPQVRTSAGFVPTPEDAAQGRLTTLSRVDVGRLQEQVATPLYPLYVDLQTQDPAQASGSPQEVPKPELSEGPHLSYAGQWFIFATLTVIVYPLLLRRVARNKAAAARAEAAGDGDGTGGDGGPVDGPGGGDVDPTPAGAVPGPPA